MQIQEQAIDLDHLARYTGGDAKLNAEILQLFAVQSADLVRQLQSMPDRGHVDMWRHVTHSLKGAARAIGAFDLGNAAEKAEAVDPWTQRADTCDVLAVLNAKADAVQVFIAAYLAGER